MIKRYRIGSVFGIPIEVDVSLLVVIPVVTWVIATDVGAVARLLELTAGVQIDRAAISAGPWPWLVGVICALGLFVSVGLHELGHSLVALRSGYDIDAIQLWLLGGIAHFADQPDQWDDELRIAVAGPAVSVLLGAVGLAILTLLPTSVPNGQLVVGYLGVVNLVLAGFNLLPGFPMDGGRILRAILSRTRPLAEATELAARVGKVVALCLGLLGVVALNPFLIAIGLFVYLGASSEATQTKLRAVFEGTTVADLMTADESVRTLDAETTVASALDRMYDDGHTGYPVCRDGNVVGVVTLEDLSRLRASEQASTAVEDVMSTDLVTVSAGTPAFEALQTMDEEGVGRLLVTDEQGELAGLVTRSDLLTALAVASTTPEVARAGRSRLAMG